MQEGKYVDNYKTNIWGLERIEKKIGRRRELPGKQVIGLFGNMISGACGPSDNYCFPCECSHLELMI